MTTPLVPPMLIEPPAQPTISGGLFGAAVGPMELPAHGIGGGIRFDNDWCGDGHLYPAVCDATPPSKVFDTQDAVITGLPFFVYASLLCGAIGYRTSEYETRARRRLATSEQPAVELGLWGGDAVSGVTGVFQQFAPAPLAAVDTFTEGVAALEQELASCNAGKEGFIHGRPRTAAYMANEHLTHREGTGAGAVVRTARGNRLVWGDGYSGIGPGGEALDPATEWLFATGRILLWRADVEVIDPRQTIDRSLNQQYVIAERPYVIAVECCVAAIEVTLPVLGGP